MLLKQDIRFTAGLAILFLGNSKSLDFRICLYGFYSNKLARITLPLIMAFKGGYFADRYFLLILRINNVGLGGHFLC